MSMHTNRTNHSLKLILVVALTGRDATTDVAFPIWMATKILCNRQAYNRSSPVTILKRLPSSLRKSLEFGPMVSHVSTATGWNWFMWGQVSILLGLVSFRMCSSSSWLCGCSSTVWLAKVSTRGIPHQILSLLPWDHGHPPGRFPSAWCSPEDSSQEGIFVKRQVMQELFWGMLSFATGVDLCSKGQIKAKYSSESRTHHAQSHFWPWKGRYFHCYQNNELWKESFVTRGRHVKSITKLH